MLCDLWCHHFRRKRKVCSKIKSLSHATPFMVKLCIDSIKNWTKPMEWWFIRCLWNDNEILFPGSYHFIHGIILPNLIQIYIWGSKSKSIHTIICGSIWKIISSINNTCMECLLSQLFIKSYGSFLCIAIIHPHISKLYKLHGINEYDRLFWLLNVSEKFLVKPL